MPELILVTGGVKSGKSRLAADCLTHLTPTPTLIATARRTDSEMSARIDRHIADRDERWQTIETPLHLADALIRCSQPVLVDCLGVWLTNLLIETPEQMEEAILQFLQALDQRSAATVLVSNESSLGIIGADALTRRYIDELGLLNQSVARKASHVVMSIVGLPQWLKGTDIRTKDIQ
ncbi:bifunctional adenosylcobinamide kinase/adenosylcobinamide-phosphate guanylyltransferase [Reinekea blandensis]|uniref:Bifunctional adenosylcobalamin biosynthesis protein n=1 Tax=Reinekea blandensis MED297 TaxID=314283 RepID=A4BIB6_9GAMM|nr:bifunctional adenosylcobinamide kinase/adenosylcobinamide-phosphate guanylyltransferase [Reinekea blandensis]EAR08123.1 cobinamide kinase/cobinamide phosphate guanylyltransferase [Reinekea sp. MED297] [Reinekea blandensis MED297]